MTQENPENPKPETPKSVELREKIRNAVVLKFLHNATDAQIAEMFKVSVYTIADWKRRKEWKEGVKAISNEQMSDAYNELSAMGTYAREVLQKLLNDESPSIRLRAAQFLCDYPVRMIR